MRSAEPPHIVMEILWFKRGTLPFPNPRRNTSLPILGIARSGNKVETNWKQSGNLFPHRFQLVIALLPVRFRFVNTLSSVYWR